MNKSKQQGLSFIEVLVAVVVISIGLLGIVGLQGAAVSNTTISSMRSNAAIEAGNLVARMRANKAFWQDKPTAGGGYTLVMAVDSNDDRQYTETGETPLGDESVLTTINTCTGLAAGVNCSAEKLAAYDIDQWYQGLIDSLHPKASATIVYTNIPANPAIPTPQENFIRVIISWDEKKSAFVGGNTVTNNNYFVSVRL